MFRFSVKKERQSGLGLALTILALITAVISAATLKFGVDVHVPIVMLAAVIAAVDFFCLGIGWEDLQKAALDSIMAAIPSCMILMLVGVLIGLWMRTGVIPGLIFYGLNVLSPSCFPLAAMVICAVIALSTGSSWSTEATIGVAMMGIGSGLGVPPAMTAGCVVSGAYFGDKMSPLSDTTNLAPAVSGNNLFDHIRAMCWTTVPSLIIAGACMTWWGTRFAGQALDAPRIQAIQTMLAAEFSISPLCALPPLLVIAASMLKIPAMPGICIGIAASCVMGAFQGVSLGELWTLGQWGYKARLSAQIAGAEMAQLPSMLAQAGIDLSPASAKDAGALIARLVGRGGLQNMMWSVSLAVAAMAMGGLLERGGMLKALLDAATRKVRRAGGLVSMTLGACLVSNLLTGSQYMSIIIPGRMFKAKYEQSGLAPRMLSRSLEDCGTLTSVLIPWNVCAGYAAGVLGVSTAEYLPYAVFNWVTPLAAMALTYMGIGVFRRGRDGTPVRCRSVLSGRTEGDGLSGTPGNL